MVNNNFLFCKCNLFFLYLQNDYNLICYYRKVITVKFYYYKNGSNFTAKLSK